jgi:hypothetical protein
VSNALFGKNFLPHRQRALFTATDALKGSRYLQLNFKFSVCSRLGQRWERFVCAYVSEETGSSPADQPIGVRKSSTHRWLCIY